MGHCVHKPINEIVTIRAHSSRLHYVRRKNKQRTESRRCGQQQQKIRKKS